MHPSRARSTPRSLTPVGLLLLILTAAPLAAQGPPGEAMAFPRDLLRSYLAGDSERVWEHAGPTLRELAGSAAELRESAAEMTEMMGAETNVLSEQLFDHPEDRNWQVYVRAARHARVPEMFWVVIFSPADRQVQVIMPQPRQTIRTLFPQVTLP